MINEVFLDRVYELSKQQRLDEAINVICGHLSELLRNKDFLHVDDILKKANVQKMQPSLMVAFLLVTAQKKELLKHRFAFYDKAEQFFTNSKIDISDLCGLK